MRLGEESGGMREDVWRVQIKHTVKKHLEKEIQLRGRDVKVLSLFFIDRVANYRDYDGSGRPVKGKFAEAFEATLAEFAKDSPLRTARMAEAADGPAAQRLLSPKTRRACSRTRGATPRPTTRFTT